MTSLALKVLSSSTPAFLSDLLETAVAIRRALAVIRHPDASSVRVLGTGNAIRTHSADIRPSRLHTLETHGVLGL